MKRIALILSLLIVLLTGCSSVPRLWHYYTATKDFTRYLNDRDYEKCISLMDMPLMESSGYTKDSLIGQMKLVNAAIDTVFGKVTYSTPTVQTNMSWSTERGGKVSYPVANVLLDNGKEFGQMQITFDTRSQKIRSFYLMNVKGAVPSMVPFWLFMVLGFLNAAFIIYVIRLVRLSNSPKKKRKYALAALLNLPTISMHTLTGISLHILQAQFLLGSGFTKQGFLAKWDLGIPLGACIVLYQLRKEKQAAEAEQQEIQAYLDDTSDTALPNDMIVSAETSDPA